MRYSSKGYRGEDAAAKKDTMDSYWVPGVNHLGTYGGWAFAELDDIYEMEDEFAEQIMARFNTLIDEHAGVSTATSESSL